jgi:hypothetical protein
MKVVQSSGKFIPTEICKINYCRLYLNVVTISDLTNMNGRNLDCNKLSGHHFILSSRAHGSPIHQDRPLEHTWKLWKKVNTLWSRSDGTLIQRLGDWVLPIHQMRQHHPAYWFAGRLWVRFQVQYTKCHPISERVFRETSSSSSLVSLSSQAVPMLALQSTPGCW